MCAVCRAFPEYRRSSETYHVWGDFHRQLSRISFPMKEWQLKILETTISVINRLPGPQKPLSMPQDARGLKTLSDEARRRENTAQYDMMTFHKRLMMKTAMTHSLRRPRR